jgi:fumarylacetoacetase
MELTDNGQQPITLASGEARSFLEDGDQVVFRAHCRRDGYAPIGFGECRVRVAG